MTTLAATYAFFSEVELYLLANTHLKSLPVEQKSAFVERYNKWLAGYKQKIKQPFFDTDGVTPLIRIATALLIELDETWLGESKRYI